MATPRTIDPEGLGPLVPPTVVVPDPRTMMRNFPPRPVPPITPTPWRPMPQGPQDFPSLTPTERLKLWMERMFGAPGAPGVRLAGKLAEGMRASGGSGGAVPVRGAPTGASPVNMALPTIAALRARLGGPRESLTARIFGA
jgi:hypothetical protein